MKRRGLLIVVLMIIINFSMIVCAESQFVQMSDLDFKKFSYISVRSSGSEEEKLISELDNIDSASDLFTMSDAVYEIQLIKTEYYNFNSRNIVKVLKTYKGEDLDKISLIERFNISLIDNVIVTNYGNVPLKKDVRYLVFLNKLDKAAFNNTFELVIPILGKYEIKTEKPVYHAIMDEYMSYDDFYSYDYLDVYSQNENIEIQNKLNRKYSLIWQEIVPELLVN